MTKFDKKIIKLNITKSRALSAHDFAFRKNEYFKNTNYNYCF